MSEEQQIQGLKEGSGSLESCLGGCSDGGLGCHSAEGQSWVELGMDFQVLDS